MKQWFIVQTYSGFEKKVAETIKDNMKKNSLEDKIDEVLVPTHSVSEVKKGKRVSRQKKYFPGYVILKMEMDKKLYHMIKEIKKVSGFLGSTGSPAPVSENEINKIMGQIKEGVIKPQSSLNFDIGEKVKVCEGPFTSFSGLVEQVDEEKSRLKVSVLIFGRPTPVDLEYNQVEKY